MKKIIIFLLFFNLIFIQNTFAKEEKTIFGFSLEFPTSKYVVLKEQNELTIKEFLKQNGYRDYKRIIRENEPKDLTTSDALKLLYKKTFEWIAKCEIVFSNFEFEGYGKERLFDFLAERYFSFFFIKYTKIKILPYKLINLNKDHEL